jgi:hypothetical protein
MQQQPALTPQQQAIQEVRARYERGILTFNQFEYALNALLQAQSPEQCEAIVQELPSSPTTALDVLTPPAAASLPASLVAPRGTRSEWLIAIMGGRQRLKRPWRLPQQMKAIMFMGGMQLDLNLAALPPHSVIQIFAMMGGAQIYVPRSLHVVVHAVSLLGGVNVLGEGSGGIISFATEESLPPGFSTDPTPVLEIRVFTLMGGVQVTQTDGPVMICGMPGASKQKRLPASAAVVYPSGPDRHDEREARRAERHARKAARRGEED